MRHTARCLRRQDRGLGVRGTDGPRGRPGGDSLAQRHARPGLTRPGLRRLHDIRTGQRNCRSGSDPFHCQMVQRRPGGIRHGSAGRCGQARNRPRIHSVAHSRGPESSGRDLHPCRDRPSRQLRTDPDNDRSAALGHFRGHGCTLRQSPRHSPGQGRRERRRQIQVLRHRPPAHQQQVHNDIAALRIFLLLHHQLQEVRNIHSSR